MSCSRPICGDLAEGNATPLPYCKMEQVHRRVSIVARHLQSSSQPFGSNSAASSGGAEAAATSASAGPSGLGSQRLLEGKVALITGSGQGIGAAAARLFAAHGAAVVVSDLEEGKARAVAAGIVAAGGSAIAVPGDVTDPAFPKRIVEATGRQYGRLDILVNNAGYTWDGVVHKMGDKQWAAMLDVHCTAPFRLIKEAARLMRDAGKQELEQGGQPAMRCILNVSSVSGTHGSAGQANYSTAKLGVVGLTKTIARGQ